MTSTALAEPMPAQEADATFVFNPRDPDFHKLPYPHYARLRDNDPIHRGQWGVWWVAKYQHVRAILKDKRFLVQDIPAKLRRRNQMLKTQRVSANQPDNIDALIENTENWFSFLDESAHGRLRKLVSSAFQKRQIDRMREHIRASAESLLDQLEGCAEFDLMQDFARKVPPRVIAQFLGVPEQDIERCTQWAHLVSRILDPMLSLEDYADMNQASQDFMAYLRELLQQRRIAPQDDLISALISARDNDDRLSEAEVISTLIFAFVAGEETAAALIGSTSLALMRNPAQRDLMVADMGLVAHAVEETLRYDSPFQMTSRTALEDVEIEGRQIRKGEQIYLFLGSANRDPEQFSEPDRYDLLRDRAHHIAFSDGAHFCVGAMLARIEVQESIAALFARFPALRLAGEEVRYCDNAVLRCLASMRVNPH
jgi:cytochrome P450